MQHMAMTDAAMLVTSVAHALEHNRGIQTSSSCLDKILLIAYVAHEAPVESVKQQTKGMQNVKQSYFDLGLEGAIRISLVFKSGFGSSQASFDVVFLLAEPINAPTQCLQQTKLGF